MPPFIDLGRIERKRSLKPFTTLRAGGSAETFLIASSADDLAGVAEHSQSDGWHTTVLGSGSNVLPSDAGVEGLVVVNRAVAVDVRADGRVIVESGCGFQELFLKTVQNGLTGLEFAVGIPGTVGGALVSNAGAYRSNISEFLASIEVVFEGKRQWVDPAFMEFSYRDSILRRNDPPQCVMVQMEFKLPTGSAKSAYDEAREYQRQRISKQPPSASAGSFFKNVNNRVLAASFERLSTTMKDAGVVPAGFLVEHAGLCGTRHGGAMVSRKHANFLLNMADASATEIRQLAGLVKRRVQEIFGVVLEEEVLYLGDWSRYKEVWEG